jgi:hypothetical protein
MSQVTLKSIKAQYSDANKVTQVDSKQLFIVTYNNYSLAISYNTIIAFKLFMGAWLITTKKYSLTTSCHCNKLTGSHINQEQLTELVSKYHLNR